MKRMWRGVLEGIRKVFLGLVYAFLFMCLLKAISMIHLAGMHAFLSSPSDYMGAPAYEGVLFWCVIPILGTLIIIGLHRLRKHTKTPPM
jgi:hypothetical protein